MGNGISIVILSHNNEGIEMVLKQALALISSLDEIIVVDDHSSGEVLSTLRQYEIQHENVTVLCAEKHCNRSYNRNVGAAHAKKDWLLFMDGDIILSDRALNALRDAISFTPCVGFSGPLHGSRYSEDVLTLCSGLNNYKKLLATEQGRQQIIDDARLTDKRSDTFLNEKYRRFRWALFFSGCCAVKKDAFQQAGGFDENFVGWGAEDVDFGYRLSQHGDIQFLPEFHSIHIPHPRNIFRINSQNHANLYYMLSKYRSWEFELLVVAKGALPVFASFLDIITQMRQLSLPAVASSRLPSSVVINVFSQETPQGSVTCCFSDGQVAEFNLFGMALPLAERSMKIALVSQNVWIYPEAVCCEVLREALRVAEEVYLCGPLPKVRICYSKADILSGPVFRFAFSIHDAMEFRFEPVRDGLVRVTSMTCDLMLPLTVVPGELDDARMAQLANNFKDLPECHDVIDCCYNGGSRILLADFIRKSSLRVGHVIQPSRTVCYAAHFQPEDALMTALLSCKRPLLFLVPSTEETPAIMELWRLRNISADIVCSMNGRIESACLDQHR